MFFDPAALAPNDCYKLITATVVPRPIAWLVTADAAGTVNAAPFSFFNAYSGAPPRLAIGIAPHPAREKDSFANIESRREFVVNLVPFALAEAMNTTAVDFPAGESETEAAGLETVASVRIGVPRIAASPVAFECVLQKVVDIRAPNRLVIGNVVAIHVADSAILNPERCHIDTEGLDLIGRTRSPGGYVRTNDRFEMVTPTLTQWLETRRA